MASTVTIAAGQDGRGASGDKLIRRGTMTLGTYAANGIAVTKAQLDFPVSITDVRIDSASGYVARWDSAPGVTSGKVMLYVGKDPGNAGGADVVLQEVGTVDVSATTFRFRAEGN